MDVTTGQFTETSTAEEFSPTGDFAISLSGGFPATVVLERRFAKGLAFKTVETFTETAEKVVIVSKQNTMAYRLTCTVYGSSPIDWAVG
jgi:hypothetical protein